MPTRRRSECTPRAPLPAYLGIQLAPLHAGLFRSRPAPLLGASAFRRATEMRAIADAYGDKEAVQIMLRLADPPLDCDEHKDRFEANLAKIAQAKPVKVKD